MSFFTQEKGVMLSPPHDMEMWGELVLRQTLEHHSIKKGVNNFYRLVAHLKLQKAEVHSFIM